MMERDSSFMLQVVIGSLYLELFSQGLRVEESHEFSYFKSICSELEGREVSAHADQGLFDFAEGNSFFLAVYNAENKVVATIAARSDNLKRTNLAQFLEKRLPRLYGGEIREVCAPAAYDISGDVVYLGDLWVRKGYPAGGLGLLLPRLSLLYSLSKFDPDFCYALHTPRMAERRGLEIGFSHSGRKAIDWAVAPPDFNEEFWLSYSRSDDLYHLAYTLFGKIHQNATK